MQAVLHSPGIAKRLHHTKLARTPAVWGQGSHCYCVILSLEFGDFGEYQ